MILHATDHGAGVPIVLLHGLYGAAQNLGMIARALADHRVIALDVRNHGASPHAPDMRYDTLAADVIETLDALGLAEIILIGHSMGGKIAMMVALRHPARVRALAVLDIAPLTYDHVQSNAALIDALAALPLTPGLTRQQANADLAASIPEPMLRSFLLNNLRLSEGAMPSWRIDLAAIKTALPMLTSWVDPQPLQPYPGPTLVLRGANSAYVPLTATGDIQQRFPRATVETIPDAGHWLHAEQPDAVNRALRRFINDVPDLSCAQPRTRLNRGA